MKIHCLHNPSSAGYEKAKAPSAKTTLHWHGELLFLSVSLCSSPAVYLHRFPPQPVSCDTFISCIQQFRASPSNLAGLRPSFRGCSLLQSVSKVLRSFISLRVRGYYPRIHSPTFIAWLLYISFFFIIQICIIFCARLNWPSSSDTRMWIWVCEIRVRAAFRKTDECSRSVGSVVRKMLRLVQMNIDEDPGNRLLNRSKTILIRILSVTLVLLLLLFPQLRSTILNIYSIEFAKLYVQFIIPRRD